MSSWFMCYAGNVVHVKCRLVTMLEPSIWGNSCIDEESVILLCFLISCPMWHPSWPLKWSVLQSSTHAICVRTGWLGYKCKIWNCPKRSTSSLRVWGPNSGIYALLLFLWSNLQTNAENYFQGKIFFPSNFSIVSCAGFRVLKLVS